MDDRQRFERVYASHYDAVLRYCVRRTQREDALDAAAETFMVAWRRKADMPPGRELPWLYGVARRVLANQRRSAHRLRSATLRLRVVGDGSASEPEPQLVQSQENSDIVAAAARLRPEDQEVLRLAGWEELDRSKIASILGCSPNAVSKRLNRALDRLAKELGVVTRARGRFLRRREVGG